MLMYNPPLKHILQSVDLETQALHKINPLQSEIH